MKTRGLGNNASVVGNMLINCVPPEQIPARLIIEAELQKGVDSPVLRAVFQQLLSQYKESK